MINLSITLSERDRANLDALAKLFPREMVQANGRAASIVKRKLRAAMSKGGGTPDEPTFAALDPLTVALKGRSKPGGVLAESGHIVMYRLGFTLVVGWPDKMQSNAQDFQSAETRPTKEFERHSDRIQRCERGHVGRAAALGHGGAQLALDDGGGAAVGLNHLTRKQFSQGV